MKIWIFSIVFAMSSLVVMSQSCPSEHFSAVITATIDGAVDKPQDLYLDDPELTYFRTHMKFRDSDIQHTIEDAINFFNYTYGIDFSNLAPNERNEYTAKRGGCFDQFVWLPQLHCMTITCICLGM